MKGVLYEPLFKNGIRIINRRDIQGLIHLIAKEHGADISLVHVVEPVHSYGVEGGVGINFDQWQTELEQSAKMQMSKIGEKLSIPSERQFLSIGQIKRGILTTAEKVNADLIIVGTHARHGISALFMGNTAEDMVHNAKCDVLTINVAEKATV